MLHKWDFHELVQEMRVEDANLNLQQICRLFANSPLALIEKWLGQAVEAGDLVYVPGDGWNLPENISRILATTDHQDGGQLRYERMLDVAIRRQYPYYYKKTFRKRRFGLSAFRLGWESMHNGELESACPFDGNVTFYRAYIKTWLAGRKAYMKLMIAPLQQNREQETRP